MGARGGGEHIWQIFLEHFSVDLTIGKVSSSCFDCFSDPINYERFSVFLRRNVTAEPAVTCVIHNPETTFVTAIRAT